MALVLAKRKIKALLALALFWASGLRLLDAQEARTLAPAWERAIGGDATCPPAAFRGRVYVLSVDRSLTCLDEAGGFVWRKALKNRPAPRLTVSKSGLVCVFGRNGEMTAYSASGSQLWTYSGKKGALPVLSPHEGRDGRLFILYEDEMVCIAANGVQKWRVRINGRGAQMIGENGRGNVLVVRPGGDVTPVSPYGTVYPTVKTGLNIRRAIPLAGHAAALFVSDGTSSHRIVAVDFNPARNRGDLALAGILWERRGLAQPIAVMRYSNFIYCAGSDGSLLILNIADGEILSQTEFSARGLAGRGSLFHDKDGDGGRVILLTQGSCIAFSLDGQVLWQAMFSKPVANPVFTENGYVISAPQGSIIAAYRAEVSPGRKSALEERGPRASSYRIFAGKSRDYMSPLDSNFRYFEDVQKKINEGNLGRDEREISRRLAEILNNDNGGQLSVQSFAPPQRAFAAHLLGLMGSEEARAVLVDAARTESDPTVIAGILRGFAALGPENGRQAFDAVMRISRQQGRQYDICALVCDALLSIARSSYGEIAGAAADAIQSYTGSQYSWATRKYALKTVEKLME